MKVSEYISVLEKLKDEHGDLDVETYSVDGNRRTANEPRISFRLILKGREYKQRFFNSWEGLDRKGDAVIEI